MIATGRELDEEVRDPVQEKRIGIGRSVAERWCCGRTACSIERYDASRGSHRPEPARDAQSVGCSMPMSLRSLGRSRLSRRQWIEPRRSVVAYHQWSSTMTTALQRRQCAWERHQASWPRENLASTQTAAKISIGLRRASRDPRARDVHSRTFGSGHGTLESLVRGGQRRSWLGWHRRQAAQLGL